MVPILDLWMPIVVAAVLVFLVSFIVHMVLTYHRTDYRQLPKEDETLQALRQSGVAPGMYFFPYSASPKEMGTPEMLEKYRQGPVGMLTVMPSGPPAMPKFLALWFGYCLLVGVFVAYLVGRGQPAGAPYLTIFRFAGAAAFMSYGVANLVNGIWRGQSWPSVAKEVWNGLLYSLATAGAFGWLWPR